MVDCARLAHRAVEALSSPCTAERGRLIAGESMYLTRLEIKNLKLIRELELDFTRDGKWRQWTVLVGRNGRGKTTLLQAIALAAVGSRRVNQLAGSFVDSMPDLRAGRGKRPLAIEADFDLPRIPHVKLRRGFPGLPDDTRAAALRVGLKAEDGDLIGTSRYLGLPSSVVVTDGDPLASARGRELPFWFVAAYGVSRHIHVQPNVPQPSRANVERLKSIFAPEPLIGLGFASLFDDEKTSQFNSFLSRVVRHHEGITPDIDQLVVHGRKGIRTQKELIEKERVHYRVGTRKMKIPAAWLSHGYQSTLAWLGDLIGQYLLEVHLKSLGAEQMMGLVLIDEIDLYLHPTWQRGFIEALSAAFPLLQFVVTTHSPALLAAFRPDEIVLLDQDPERGDIVRRPYVDDPRLMTGSEVYEEFFDLASLRRRDLVEGLRRHRFLANDPYRTDHEDAELASLAAALRGEYPDVALSTPVERSPLPPLGGPT